MIIGASATWSTRKRRPIGIESRELQAEQRNNRTDCRGLSIKSRVPRVPSPESRVPLADFIVNAPFKIPIDTRLRQSSSGGIGDWGFCPSKYRESRNRNPSHIPCVHILCKLSHCCGNLCGWLTRRDGCKKM